MTTTTPVTPAVPTRPINDNSISMAQYKGEVRPCPFCKPLDKLSGAACRWCLSQGYVAMCLNCNGTGSETRGAVWDGGKTQHSSTCNQCGGKGVFPARAADYVPPPQPTPAQDEPIVAGPGIEVGAEPLPTPAPTDESSVEVPVVEPSPEPVPAPAPEPTGPEPPVVEAAAASLPRTAAAPITRTHHRPPPRRK